VSSAESVPFSNPKSKVLKYAEYKAAAFQAYGLCFTGEFRYLRSAEVTLKKNVSVKIPSTFDQWRYRLRVLLLFARFFSIM
jgi:hypothetical protein